jgi:hypothetical protein
VAIALLPEELISFSAQPMIRAALRFTLKADAYTFEADLAVFGLTQQAAGKRLPELLSMFLSRSDRLEQRTDRPDVNTRHESARRWSHPTCATW